MIITTARLGPWEVRRHQMIVELGLGQPNSSVPIFRTFMDTRASVARLNTLHMWLTANMRWYDGASPTPSLYRQLFPGATKTVEKFLLLLAQRRLCESASL